MFALAATANTAKEVIERRKDKTRMKNLQRARRALEKAGSQKSTDGAEPSQSAGTAQAATTSPSTSSSSKPTAGMASGTPAVRPKVVLTPYQQKGGPFSVSGSSGSAPAAARGDQTPAERRAAVLAKAMPASPGLRTVPQAPPKSATVGGAASAGSGARAPAPAVRGG